MMDQKYFYQTQKIWIVVGILSLLNLLSFLLFYNILSNCHNSDKMNYLLNAFQKNIHNGRTMLNLKI